MSQNSNPQKIVIVGAGPAGLFAAILLSRQGKHVRIYEARSNIKRKICGEYLCPRGVKLLLDSKLSIPANFLPVVGMHIMTPWYTTLTGDFPLTSEVSCGGLAVPRDLFEEWLAQEAIKLGVEIFFEKVLSGIKAKPNGYLLNFQNDPQAINCDLLIGADGRMSFVAKSLGWELERDFSKLALHSYLPVVSHTDRRGQMHLLGAGIYLGLDPVKEQELNVSLVIDRELFRTFSSAAECLQYYWDKSPILTKAYGRWPRQEKIYSISPINHACHTIADKNAALIGDAAGFLDPLTGEGMYNAIQSAELLVNALQMNTENWWQHYTKSYGQILGQKKYLNQLFQILIRYKLPMRLVEFFLRTGHNRPHHFIGLIGNVWRPLPGLMKLFFNQKRPQVNLN